MQQWPRKTNKADRVDGDKQQLKRRDRVVDFTVLTRFRSPYQ